MSTKHAYIRTRLDPNVKDASDQILHQLGLTTPEAIRLFLVQVVIQGGLPFRIELQPHQSETNDDLLLPVHMRQAALEVVYDD